MNKEQAEKVAGDIVQFLNDQQQSFVIPTTWRNKIEEILEKVGTPSLDSTDAAWSDGYRDGFNRAIELVDRGGIVGER